MRIVRLNLAANQKTPVTPPETAAGGVIVGNATNDDLKVVDSSGDVTEYIVIAAGYEKYFPNPGNFYSPNVTVFLLLSAVGGVATIEWL